MDPIPQAADAGATVETCQAWKGYSGKFKTLQVGERSVPRHLAHGDMLGSCTDDCGVLCDDADVGNDGEDVGCVIDLVSCEDGDFCRLDSCDPELGCVVEPNPDCPCPPDQGPNECFFLRRVQEHPVYCHWDFDVEACFTAKL